MSSGRLRTFMHNDSCPQPLEEWLDFVLIRNYGNKVRIPVVGDGNCWLYAVLESAGWHLGNLSNWEVAKHRKCKFTGSLRDAKYLFRVGAYLNECLKERSL
jgi:hypothetical protein